MKRLLFSLLTLSLISTNLVGMEKPTAGLPTQSRQENSLTIIASDGSAHTLPEKHALCSETIKHQVSDTCEGEIYLPYIKDKKHFDLISLFLGFAQEIQEFDQQCDAQGLSQDNKVILRRELSEELKNRSVKDLHQLILACNYLDVPIILDAAIDELAERLGKKEMVNECLMKGCYEIAPNEKLDLDLNMAHAIAQRMLKKSGAKPWYLLQKLIGNSSNLPGKELIQKKHYGLLTYNEKKSMYALESTNQIFLYDHEGKQIGKPLDGHAISRSHALFNNDGTLLACMYSGNILRVWDVETQKEIAHFSDAMWIYSNFHFSPDSQFLIYIANDRSLNVIDLKTMSLFKKISGIFPNYIQLSADGSMMAAQTRSHDGYNYVELFETRNFTSVKRIHFANHGDVFLAIGGTKNFSKLAIAVKTNNYPGTKIIFYDTKKKLQFDNGILLDDLYESSTQSSHEEIVLNRTCEYLVLHLNEDQTILVLAAQFLGERGDNLLMFDFKTKKQISHARIKGYFTTDITDNRLFSIGSHQYYHSEIANPDDKKEFETTIKTPEQAALLLSAYHCSQEGIPFTFKNFPGIKKITMPNCLKPLFVATFYQESWSQWALRMAPAALAMGGPLAIAYLGSLRK